MATVAEHQTLYANLRQGILTRHYAAGVHARHNWLHDDRLLPRVTSPAPGQKIIEEWDWVAQDYENPHHYNLHLMTALSVEHALGNPAAKQILDLTLDTISGLYHQQNTPGWEGYGKNRPEFEGYPMRWDPGLDNWVLGPDGQPFRARNFLQRPNGTYIHGGLPTTDPRHAPKRSADVINEFMPNRAKDGSALDPWMDYDYGRRWLYGRMYRGWEVSSDDLVGLIGTYAVIHDIANDQQLKDKITQQARPLRAWLCGGSFLLTRPSGGLTNRGGAGFATALEAPYRAAFTRILGDDGPATAPFQVGLERIGLFPAQQTVVSSMTSSLEFGLVFGIGAVLPLLAFAGGLVATLAAAVATHLGPIGDGLLSGFTGSNADSWFMSQNEVGSAVGQLTRHDVAFALAVWGHMDGVDHGDDDLGEVVVSTLLQAIDPSTRYAVGVLAMTLKDAKPATWIPALGLMNHTEAWHNALYARWFDREKALRPTPSAWGDRPPVAGPGSALASAVALLAAPSPGAEAELLRRLDALHGWIMAEADNPPRPARSSSTSRIPMDDLPRTGGVAEKPLHVPDYLAALALAWLHRSRLEAAGGTVATAGFPEPPADWSRLTTTVPTVFLRDRPELQAAYQVHGSPQGKTDLDVFGPDVHTGRRIGAPWGLPPDGTLLFQQEVELPRTHTRDVGTDVFVRHGDRWGIRFLYADDGYDPDGTKDIVDDARFPLYSGLDPVGARFGRVLGRLNGGWFSIGRGRPLERFLFPLSIDMGGSLFPTGEDGLPLTEPPHQAYELFLRINDRAPQGTGALHYQVFIYGDRPTPPLIGTEVSCIARVGSHIARIGGELPDGQVWHVTTPEAVRMIREEGKRFTVKGQHVHAVTMHVGGKAIDYLRTERNGTATDNLEGVPSCTHLTTVP